MTKLIVDANTLVKLHNLNSVFEVCDEAGKTLGYFHPARNGDGPNQPSRSPFSDAELRRRQGQRTGRPLAEILQTVKERL
jgi:hypothetical protein